MLNQRVHERTHRSNLPRRRDERKRGRTDGTGATIENSRQRLRQHWTFVERIPAGFAHAGMSSITRARRELPRARHGVPARRSLTSVRCKSANPCSISGSVHRMSVRCGNEAVRPRTDCTSSLNTAQPTFERRHEVVIQQKCVRYGVAAFPGGSRTRSQAIALAIARGRGCRCRRPPRTASW